jgi:hypothetical protein
MDDIFLLVYCSCLFEYPVVFLLPLAMGAASATRVRTKTACDQRVSSYASHIVSYCMSLQVANPELYPTESRATAHAVANSISHLGGFLCPYLIDSSSVNNAAIGAILGSVSLLAAVVVIATPETLGKQGVTDIMSAMMMQWLC